LEQQGQAPQLTPEAQQQQVDAIKRLHAGLSRQGPGSDDNTLSTLERLPKPIGPVVCDLGCGPGRASIALAKALKRPIICVDLEENFLKQLRIEAVKEGLTELIDARQGDMWQPVAVEAPINLIWCEGAIYCVGFDNALSSWHRQLAPGGFIVCSELSWLTAEPSDKPSQFWQTNYPGMRSVQANIEAAEGLGYKCIEHFTLAEHCWWDEYYNPWLANVDKLKGADDCDQFLLAAIKNAELEVDLYRRFSKEYGYEFYLLQKV
jgi:SAM-dependent methyltransferase